MVLYINWKKKKQKIVIIYYINWKKKSLRKNKQISDI